MIKDVLLRQDETKGVVLKKEVGATRHSTIYETSIETAIMDFHTKSKFVIVIRLVRSALPLKKNKNP